jgi:DNA helicase-2/ATP-dependent DNA helicase PcrA
MRYIADLHVHSCHSRATSKVSNLEGFYRWARVKGINLVGTGDFTHPLWFAELKEKLEPDGNGFFTLKESPQDLPEGLPFQNRGCSNIDIRFCLSAEISSIYKKGERTRKVHSVLFAPDFSVAGEINRRLDAIGNIRSDGRPILGLDVKDLLEIVLDVSGDAYLVPAHIWTPWFSLFGSKSGFDTIEECFEDLTGHIFALETGLSSDPEMNWRWSALDRYTLISNSDAHSPQKLGREANLFDTDFSYEAMFESLKTGKGFDGTCEFYPEEGKYHLDGHRKCGVCLEPEETRRLQGICPVCGGKLTVGVMHRVLECGDRQKGEKPDGSAGFKYCIPLPEIVSEITGNGPGSKGVLSIYTDLLQLSGNEFTFLLETPLSDIERKFGHIYAEALRRMREGEIHPKPGFDGEFGVIRVFEDEELERFLGQVSLFALGDIKKKKKRSSERRAIRNKADNKKKITTESFSPDSLNPAQRKVLEIEKGALLITAGPGTGKTKTLTSWIAHLVLSGRASPDHILAITFTNRAAGEMDARLRMMLGEKAGGIKVCTFHAFCFELIKERFPDIRVVYDDRKRISLLRILYPDLGKKEVENIAGQLKSLFEKSHATTGKDLLTRAKTYLDAIKQYGGVDLSSLIGGTITYLKKDQGLLQSLREQYSCIAVDEFQDINPNQYKLISILFPDHTVMKDGTKRCLLAIGDPDQAIYGFRGSDVGLFFRFAEEYTPVSIVLREHYRSTETVIRSAEAVINQNMIKKQESLVPVRGKGESILILRVDDPSDEAAFIASRVEELVGGMTFTSVDSRKTDSGLYSFSDIAVLTRTRAVGDALVPFLAHAGIPVSRGNASPVMAESPFSYANSLLHLLINKDDIVSSHDVILNLLSYFSEKQLLTMTCELQKKKVSGCFFDELLDCSTITDTQLREIKEFLVFYEELKNLLEQEGVAPVLSIIFQKFPLFQSCEHDMTMKKEALLGIAKEFSTDCAGFLWKCSLGPNESGCPFKTDTVRLLTFHASKGLEFPVVFIAGAEEGITPLLSKNTDPEEERRLFYVALTRAKDLVHISSASRRKVFGKRVNTEQSRFIDDIPLHLKQHISFKIKKSEEDTYEQLSLL